MLLLSREKNYEETEVCTAGDTAPRGDTSAAGMFEVKCEKVIEGNCVNKPRSLK